MKNIDDIKEINMTYGELYAFMSQAIKQKFVIVRIDGRLCRTQADFLHFMAVAMNFSYDFDYTWESFDRYAMERSAIDALCKGLLIVLDHAEDMFSLRLSPVFGESEEENSLTVKTHLNELICKRRLIGLETMVYLNYTDRRKAGDK